MGHVPDRVGDVSDEYVEGDVNRVDNARLDEDDDELELDDELDANDANDDEDDDDDANEGNLADPNRSEAALASAVLEHVATSLADEPDAVSVETDVRGRRASLRLHVAQPDMGRVIGRRGRTAQAIRALVAAAGAREGLTTSVDIVD
jgi:predicted RNA-binding protein YlqC (UPF0109 family)